jgi:hypothetical protein
MKNNGNSFEQGSVIPYEHFELAASFGVDTGNYMDLRIISDGYLFSFSPLNTASDRLKHFPNLSQIMKRVKYGRIN